MRPFRPIYCCLLLLGLTFAAYWPVWGNGFVDFDDEWYITTNPHVVQGLNWSNFRWAWTNTRANYWMPLTWLTFQLDAPVLPSRSPAGERFPSPAVVHGQNLVWHSLNVLLLFGWLKRWTGATGRSLLVAALFAVHPMHVESVAWAAERKDVLSVFFGLVTLWAYGAYAARPSWGRYGLVALAYLMSLLAKPTLVTLPFVLLLLDYWPLARLTGKGHGLRRLVLEKVPLLALAVAIGLVTLFAFENTGMAVSTVHLSWPDRLANAATAYGWYLLHSFWPMNLAVLYPHSYGAWSSGAAFLGVCLLLAITGFVFRQGQPWLLVGWLWFVVSLLPIIGLVQGGEQAWADRFCYWPHIGLGIAVVWTLADWAADWRFPAWVGMAAATFAVIGLTWLSAIQVSYWRDSATLWQRAVEVTHDNDVAHLHLGYNYLQHGQLDDARSHFAEAVRIRPDAANHQYMLGVVLLAQGQLEQAIEHLQRAVEASPRHARAWHSLAQARLQQGRWNEAAHCFREMLALQPDSPEAQTGLGQALWQIGRRQEAEEAFRTAVNLDPQQADAWHGIGQAALARGQTTEAIQDFSKALQANPQLVQAYSDLGLAFVRDEQWNRAVNYQRQAIQMLDRSKMQGQKPELPLAEGCSAAVVYRCWLGFALKRLGQEKAASEAYESALRLDPNWPARFTARAWRLSTNPENHDPRLALELATQALDVGRTPSAEVLDALAAAQAALGKFDDALKTAREALQQANPTGNSERIKAIREHIRRYENGQPVVETPAG